MSLTDLLARVESAAGPDDMLDATIELALDPTQFSTSENAKPYTASLDSALALVERLLPGWEFSLSTARHRKGWTVKTWLTDDKYSGRLVDHTTPALALLAALLRSLEQPGEEKTEDGRQTHVDPQCGAASLREGCGQTLSTESEGK